MDAEERPDPALDALVQAVMAPTKYRTLAPGLVRWVARREAAKGRPRAETVKAVRRALHQVAGAYIDARPPTARWLAELAAAEGDPGALRAACSRILKQHASARERLPLLDAFYPAVLGPLPPQPTLLDLACGLNPLALPWMALPPGSRYLACDIDSAQMEFLARALPLLGVAGDAFVCNLLDGPPDMGADVALLLKTIPCLEQLEPAIGLRLLDAVRAPRLIVSFPVRSLGGRAKGMEATYAARMDALLAQRPAWSAERLPIPGELLYRIEKPTNELP